MRAAYRALKGFFLVDKRTHLIERAAERLNADGATIPGARAPVRDPRLGPATASPDLPLRNFERESDKATNESGHERRIDRHALTKAGLISPAF